METASPAFEVALAEEEEKRGKVIGPVLSLSLFSSYSPFLLLLLSMTLCGGREFGGGKAAFFNLFLGSEVHSRQKCNKPTKVSGFVSCIFMCAKQPLKKVHKCMLSLLLLLPLLHTAISMSGVWSSTSTVECLLTN